MMNDDTDLHFLQRVYTCVKTWSFAFCSANKKVFEKKLARRLMIMKTSETTDAANQVLTV